MDSIASILFFAAAAISIGVAVEVFRRAALNAETRVLLLMVSSLGLEYVLLGVASLPALRGAQGGQRFQLTMFCAGFAFHILTYTFGLHFILLTASRLKAFDVAEYPFRSYPLFNHLSDEEFNRVATYIFSYGWALLAIVVWTIAASRVIGAYSAGAARRLENPLDFIRGSSSALSLFWIIAQTRVLAVLYRRFPYERQRSAIARSFFQDHSEGLTRLNITGATGADGAKEPVPVTVSSEFRVFLVVAIGGMSNWLLTTALSADTITADQTKTAAVAYFLAPLLIVLPLIYYKTRFIFFDVIIKRASYLGLVALSSGLCFRYVLYPLYEYAGLRSALAGGASLSLGAVVLAVLFVSIRMPAYRALDRYVFRRPDYRKIVVQIADVVKNFTDPEPLLEYVNQTLKQALNAEYARFEDEGTCLFQAGQGTQADHQREIVAIWNSSQPIAAAAAVAMGDRRYGRLLFGRRLHDQQYQSEDVTFLITVANQVAGMLSSFELSQQREAQKRRELQLRESLARSEMTALRAKVNPDYLFKSLSSTRDLLASDPTAAGEEIVSLSNAFRAALDATRHDPAVVENDLQQDRAI